MANRAANFAYRMKRIWETQQEPVDACIRAAHLGGERIRAFMTDRYINEPGDIPASLWRFRDNSEYVIFDNGSGIHSPRCKKGWWEEGRDWHGGLIQNGANYEG